MSLIRISPAEARVIGVLIEKEITTPEYYPLTLNALTNACNQKSNRDPIVQFSEEEVIKAFEMAREQGLVRLVEESGARVPKYRQRFVEVLHLTRPQTALLCELLLRGAQTPGELRTRAERMNPFANLTEVENVLAELASAEHPCGQPLVVRLARQTGQKEARFVHLLCGEPDVASFQSSQSTAAPAEGLSAPISESPISQERFTALEQEVAELRSALDVLREEFAAFKRQFE